MVRRINSLWTVAFMVLATLSFTGVHAKDDPLASGRWESLGVQDGVKLARKQMRNSDLFAVRGEAVIPQSIDRVASVIYDHTRWLEWAKAMSDAKLLSRGPGTERVVYQAFDMPLLVSDRDSVYKYDMVWDGNRLRIWGASVKHPRAPRTIGIRSDLIIGRWHLDPIGRNRTHLVLEVLMDPKGSLPSWLVNMVQRDYPADTINHLKKQAARADVKGIPLPPRQNVSAQPTAASGAQGT